MTTRAGLWILVIALVAVAVGFAGGRLSATKVTQQSGAEDVRTKAIKLTPAALELVILRGSALRFLQCLLQIDAEEAQEKLLLPYRQTDSA